MKTVSLGAWFQACPDCANAREPTVPAGKTDRSRRLDEAAARLLEDHPVPGWVQRPDFGRRRKYAYAAWRKATRIKIKYERLEGLRS